MCGTLGRSWLGSCPSAEAHGTQAANDNRCVHSLQVWGFLGLAHPHKRKGGNSKSAWTEFMLT